MAYENVAASFRSDVPILVIGTDVQLYGLWKAGGGCGGAVREVVVLLIPRTRSSVVRDLSAFLSKLKLPDSA